METSGNDFPTRDVMTEYKQGDRVRHPKRLEWGVGQVLRESTPAALTVFFERAGEKTLSLEVVQPERVEGEAAASIILDALDFSDIDTRYASSQVLCKNCGAPTTFSELAHSARYTLGWCQPCFRQSHRTYRDPDTGREVCSDESRTIDGIKNIFAPK